MRREMANQGLTSAFAPCGTASNQVVRAHTFRRNTSANLDVWFFDHHPRFNRFAARATIFGSQHPFAISIGQSRNWHNTDASRVVAAIPRAEADSPSSLVEND